MKAVSVGEVYYATSPFKVNQNDPDHYRKEKRLSYLLGTVSARPVLVIREPKVWDNFGSVVVLPALSHEKLTMSVEMYNRYGRYTMDYKFCPHMLHTIPVSRLGRYIGRLTDEEFLDIIDAVIWGIGDNTGYKVPKVYADVVKNEHALSLTKKDPEETPVLHVKTDRNNRTVEISTDHGAEEQFSISGEFDMSTTVCPSEIEMAEKVLFSDFTADVLQSSQPVDTKREWVWTDDDSSVSKTFPESVVPYEKLLKYAGNFVIPESYFDEHPPKTASVLTEDEVINIRGDELSAFQAQGVIDMYDKLTYFDQFFLAPRCRTTDMAEMYGLAPAEAMLLKRLSCHIRDMDDEEYKSRLMSNHIEETDDTPAEPATEEEKKYTSRDYGYLRPYLNDKMINRIPKTLQPIFLNAPQHVIKSMYVGKSFKAKYDGAMKSYLTDD